MTAPVSEITYTRDFCASCHEPVTERSDRPGAFLHDDLDAVLACPGDVPRPGGEPRTLTADALGGDEPCRA